MLIFLLIVLLLMCGVLLYLLLRGYYGASSRRPDGMFIPRTLPTGDTLARLVWRFQRLVDSALLGRRLARLYAVLFDPDLILDYIDDTYLAPQVEASNLNNNASLFRCVAAVEKIVEGSTFSETPDNTVAAYLRAEFKRCDWDWPTHPLVWKQFFLNHYTDRLFESSG